MRKNLQFILALFLFCSGFQLNAQLNLSWANSAGNTGTEKSLSTVVDGNGDVITTGYFTGKVNFDPGNSNTILVADGQEDVFVLKHDAAGNFLWVIQIGGGQDEHGTGITFDGNNDYIICGWFQSKPYFDYVNLGNQLASAGAEDAFVCKIDNGGNFVWVHQSGGPDPDLAYGLAIDGNGDVGVAGSFETTCDFDYGNNVNITANAMKDAYVMKIDNSGNFVWAVEMQSSGNEEGLGVATDSNNDFYVTGYFENKCTFDPNSANITLKSAGLQDVFAIRADNGSGKFQWAVQMGDANSDIGNGIDIDANDYIYLTGSFDGNCDFDPNGSTYILNTIGQKDAFVNQIENSAGAFQWAIQMGSAIDDVGHSVYVENNEVHVTGSFGKTCDFDPTSSNTSLTSSGGADIFVAKYSDSNGAFISTDNIGAGSTGDDEGLSIYVEPSNYEIFVSGYFNGTTDFDPTSGTTNLTSNGAEDLFVAKYKTNSCAQAVMNTFNASSTSICTSAQTTLTLNGTLNTATSWELYSGSCGGTFVGSNATGVFSVTPSSTTTYYIKPLGGCATYSTCLNITLTTNAVPNTSIAVSSATTCAGQTTTLTASGAATYSWSTGSTNPVISVSPIVSTNYTVTGSNGGCKKTYTTAIAVTALPTITLTSNPAAACAGVACTITVTGGVSNYTWNTGATTSSIVVTPTTATTYSISGNNGTCSNNKSIVVNTSANPTITAVSNSTLLCVGQSATLTSNGAASYTWNTGSNSSVIVITPTITTSYTVTGANGFGCKSAPIVLTQSVSTCLDVENLLAGQNGIEVYPNPNNGLFNVSLTNILNNPIITLYDELGRQVMVKRLSENVTNINLIEFARGVYMYKITNNLGELKHGMVVKEY